MIINIPGTWFGWWSDEAFAIYLIVDTILVVLYCAIWIICFKKSSIFRALALSVIPSVLFLFSGIMSRSILLLIAAILFAPSHILLSYKNAKWYWLNSSLYCYSNFPFTFRLITPFGESGWLFLFIIANVKCLFDRLTNRARRGII